MFWESKWLGRKSYAVVEKYFEETMKTGPLKHLPSMAVFQRAVVFVE